MIKKCLISLSLTLFAFQYFAVAQEMNVLPVEKATDDGKQPAMHVEIPDADLRTISKAWKKQLKNFENEKVRKRRKRVEAKNIRMPEVKPYPMDVLVKLDKTGSGIGVDVFWKAGDQYLDQGQEGYENAEAFVKDFAITQRKLILEEKIEEHKENIEDVESRQEKLMAEKQELNEQIEECKEVIKDSEKALKQSEKNLSEVESVINEKRNKLEELQNQLKDLD